MQQLGGRVPGEEHASAVQARDRHEVELQLGDDPEVALAAAQRPEQLGVADGVDPPDRAVGGDDLGAAHVVGGEPVAAGHRAEPAAEGVADHADLARRPAQRGQAVRRGGLDHLRPPRARPDAGGAGHRVDRHRRQAPGGDEHTAGQVGDQPVPGGPDGHRVSPLGGPADGGGDVVGARGAHDHRGAGVCVVLKPATSAATRGSSPARTGPATRICGWTSEGEEMVIGGLRGYGERSGVGRRGGTTMGGRSCASLEPAPGRLGTGSGPPASCTRPGRW